MLLRKMENNNNYRLVDYLSFLSYTFNKRLGNKPVYKWLFNVVKILLLLTSIKIVIGVMKNTLSRFPFFSKTSRMGFLFLFKPPKSHILVDVFYLCIETYVISHNSSLKASKSEQSLLYLRRIYST